jgi:hypothetical protein
MKRNARKAFTALKKLNAPVFDHGDPNNQWGAHFILGAERRTSDDRLFADHYCEEIKEHRNEDGKIINAFGIRQDVIDILDANELYAEWIDGGTVGIYSV